MITLMSYLITSGGLGLLYWVDANFMGDHDSRSVGGHIGMSTAGIVTWVAKRLSTISTSTPHAETQAFFQCVKDNIHTRGLIDKLPFPNDVLWKPTDIFGDNSACVELAKSANTAAPSRTRHWKMNWHFLHEERCNLKSFVPLQVMI